MQLHGHVAVKVYQTCLKSIQNVIRVLKCKLEDVDATA